MRPPSDFTNVPVRRAISLGMSGAQAPKSAFYTLRAFLVQGCEIPTFKNAC